jgi:hypothetical protein
MHLLGQLGARRRSVLAGCLVLAVVAVLVPATAPANLTGEVQQGQRLLELLHSGQKRCSDLSADDFELIGEYAMGRYLGSAASHEAMNRHLTWMLGRQAEQRIHMALGYRYSSCSGGPRWLGQMGSMMSGRYGSRSSDFGPGVPARFSHWRSDSDVPVWGIALIIFAAAIVSGGIVALTMRLRRRRGIPISGR